MTISRPTVSSFQRGYEIINPERTRDDLMEPRVRLSQDTAKNNELHDVNSNATTQRSPVLWVTTGRSFVRGMFTPMRLLITIYGLNIVAWGGMLFLLMCNAAPAMCHPDCDSLNSSRRIWIEIDSQILNALFCVTGFGLAPWRIRDLFFWCFWRLRQSERSRHKGFSRLADIHSSWFCRSQGSANLLPTVSTSIKAEPILLAPTPPWKMDAVVWGNMLNTVFQVCLAVCMWAMNRFNRPSWTTGLFVGLACLVAATAGAIIWLEKRRLWKAQEHARQCTAGGATTDSKTLSGPAV